MRIISGAYKGRKLHSYPGLSIRPTSDRTRESIFNILTAIFQSFAGKRVLDLYAGTGALGIEALSRGAQRATFVESGMPAGAVLRKNVSFIPDPDACEIMGVPVSIAIGGLHRRGEQFDLIFMDPPYGKNLIHATLEQLSTTSLCAPQAAVLCEHFVRDAVSQQYGRLQLFDSRRYGQTVVSFFSLSE